MSIDRVFTRNIRVLVAPLDWGLGHATRCIPIIRQLNDRNVEVFIGAEGAIETLLRQEFPDLTFLPLKGYRVQYAKTAVGLMRKMLAQLPRLYRIIRNEHRWLQHAILEHKIDAVISDNRYGLYSKDIPCIFITHQLQIKTGLTLTDRIARSLNYFFINKFSECWVPDNKNIPCFAGELSHPHNMPAIPVHYIGILSRLRKSQVPVIPNHLFVSLSGPEPQRSLFEKKLVDQLSHYNHSATIVRGLPQEDRLLPSTNTLRFFNHLPAASIEMEMAKAGLVITRSGYSSVMDLATMNKQAVLVPTPGQTEQQYLASWLMENGFALKARQSDFNLEKVLRDAENFFREKSARPPESSGSGAFKRKHNVDSTDSDATVAALQKVADRESDAAAIERLLALISR